jgi:hypothetical protein
MPDDEFLIYPDRLSAKPQVFEGVFRPPDLERLEDELAGRKASWTTASPPPWTRSEGK